MGNTSEKAKAKENETYLKVMRRNKCRTLVQDTLKGLSKGLNMSSFVLKGIIFSGNNWQYFILTLFTRGVASALIKAFCMSYILRVKNLKLKKAQLNILYHVLPSTVLFFSLRFYKQYLEGDQQFPILEETDLDLMSITDDFDSVDSTLLDANTHGGQLTKGAVKTMMRES